MVEDLPSFIFENGGVRAHKANDQAPLGRAAIQIFAGTRYEKFPDSLNSSVVSNLPDSIVKRVIGEPAR